MPKLVDKEKKSKEILDKAIKLFAEKGLAEVKMNDVATAAGVGKGTLYEYFANKDELIGAAFMEFFKVLGGVFERQMASETDPEKLIRIILDGFLEYSKAEFGDHLYIMVDFWTYTIRNKDKEQSDVYQKLRTVYQGYTITTSEIIQRGIEMGYFRDDLDVKDAAATILALGDGLMLQWMMDKEFFNLERTWKFMSDMFFDYIKK